MTRPLPTSPCPLGLSIPVMSNYLRCPGSICLLAYFTNRGTCSVLGAILVASRILTHLNLVTNLTLEEKLSKRGSGTEPWSLSYRVVGPGGNGESGCAWIYVEAVRMPVLSLCQEPLLECHMRGSRSSLPASCLLLLPRSFTLLRPFAFVWHVHHRLIALPVCPWSAYKVLRAGISVFVWYSSFLVTLT